MHAFLFKHAELHIPVSIPSNPIIKYYHAKLRISLHIINSCSAKECREKWKKALTHHTFMESAFYILVQLENMQRIFYSFWSFAQIITTFNREREGNNSNKSLSIGYITLETGSKVEARIKFI